MIKTKKNKNIFAPFLFIKTEDEEEKEEASLHLTLSINSFSQLNDHNRFNSLIQLYIMVYMYTYNTFSFKLTKLNNTTAQASQRIRLVSFNYIMHILVFSPSKIAHLMDGCIRPKYNKACG